MFILLDPSLKSIFAQNESCRSSFPLQLLFWPNFMFPYQILSFGWSKSDQNCSNAATVLHCVTVFATVSRAAHTGDCGQRHLLHASAIAPRCRSSSSLSRRGAVSISSIPFVLSLALVRSQAEHSSPSTTRRPFLAVPPRTLHARAP